MSPDWSGVTSHPGLGVQTEENVSCHKVVDRTVVLKARSVQQSILGTEAKTSSSLTLWSSSSRS